jgi:hypothetical protein
MSNTETATRNREAWLDRAIDLFFRPLFAQLGYKIPDVVHVSVGWGQGRAGAESKDIAGQCWSGVTSEDSAPHIFISPMLSDPIEVLGTVAHELVHATLDPVMDHGKEFRSLATKIGLVGKMTATVPDVSTSAQYMLLTQPDGDLGPYPHSALSILELPVRSRQPEMAGGPPRRVTSGPAKQEARWVKVVCPDHEGAPVVRTSRRAVEDGRGPLCGEPVDDHGTPCGQRMTLPE